MSSAQSQPQPRDATRPARRLLAALVATGLGLALFEVGVRVLGLAPALPSEYGRFVADSVLPWKPEPGSHHKGLGQSGEFHFDYRHNALGFRDVDHTLEKAAGVFRIVGIGDSFTYGVGADYANTYLSQVERLLADRLSGQLDVEVIKLGVPRYWPEPERLVLEHFGLAYQPDLVIIGVPPNDFNDMRAGLQGLGVSDGYLVTQRSEQLGDATRWLFVHSQGARALLSAWLRRSAADAGDSPVPISRDETWARIHDEHRRMVELAASVGAPTLIVHIPQRPPWADWAPDPPARLARFCRSAGCSFVDVLPAARAHADPGSLYYPVDGHCTEAGYALVAREIVRSLEREALVPGLTRAGASLADARESQP